MDTLYTSDGCTYSGMSQETVERLRGELGRTTEWVTKEQSESINEAAAEARRKGA